MREACAPHTSSFTAPTAVANPVDACATTSLAHAKLQKLLERRVKGMKRRSGLFVHASLLANFKEPDVNDLYTADGRKKVLMPGLQRVRPFREDDPRHRQGYC